MTLETVTGTAPAYWASYLINRDDSGLEPSELGQADRFADWLGGNIVSCTSEEDEDHPGFMRSHDAARVAGVLAAECSLYTALIDRA